MKSLNLNNKICIIDHAGHTSQFDLAITLAKNNHNVIFAYTKNLSTPNANFQKHKNQIYWEQESNNVKEPKLPKNLIF